MAKTLNSICFTTLLLVVLFISAEIPKSEANKCDKYLGEVVTVPQPCKERVCEAQCHEHYEHVCKGECEENHDDGVHVNNHDHDDLEHCYCYAWRQ
ncbi:Defensin-like protein [Cardamine amara subsp. amara]|uniref:Defensin-like protein n=1 Tax=Cardamine amara subsp. amara TaxID=228776 RepID=A0ABD1B7N3_CARAN